MSHQFLRLKSHYQADPLACYQHLSGGKPGSLLLESAEPSAGNAKQSLAVLDAALEIRALGQQIRVTSLSANGAALLPALAGALGAEVNGDSFTVTVPRPDPELDEDQRLKAPSVLSVVRELLALLPQDPELPFASLVAGLFGFDLIASFEALPEVGGNEQVPDLCLYLAETLLHVDHQRQSASLQALCLDGADSASYFELSRRLARYHRQLEQVPALEAIPAAGKPEATEVLPGDADFEAQVARLKEHILAGDCFQVVPSRRFLAPCPEPLKAYRALRAQNPSPYMFYLAHKDFTLFGASPESALTVDSQSRQLSLYPIAGTRPRGMDADADARIELELRLDEKEQAEHLMLVDLARNDVARVAEPGSRALAELLKVDRYARVMHLVSRVTGTLRSDLDALHAYQAAMNMGTLTGAPKVRASELIRQVEGRRRGAYGGAIGYLTARGDMDSAIVIRSAQVVDGTACVQAGAGVVYDSVPRLEAEETRHKASAVLAAIAATQEAR
ncbi:anthranilate synthase component 1 [Gallaecimonas sp. GXIMD4217]|uniref:anthranilate synthase component 1 n=1 Tax=Gallaecimonas sp. GXIMD4217 TaxID=3131927 RepID=UPI00311B3D66